MKKVLRYILLIITLLLFSNRVNALTCKYEYNGHTTYTATYDSDKLIQITKTTNSVKNADVTNTYKNVFDVSLNGNCPSITMSDKTVLKLKEENGVIISLTSNDNKKTDSKSSNSNSGQNNSETQYSPSPLSPVDDIYPEQAACIYYSTKAACVNNKYHSCLWIENKDAKSGAYCNVDKLLYIGCGDTSDIPLQAPSIISFIINILKIATPIILIVTSLITLVKALASQKEDEIKKATSTLIKKTISAALVFFLIVIVQFVISKVADEDEYKGFTNCLNCFLNNDCGVSTYYKANVSGQDYCISLKDGKEKLCTEMFKN